MGSVLWHGRGRGLAALALPWLVVACQQTVSGAGEDEPGSVEVVLDGQAVTVRLGELPVHLLDDGEGRARLSEVVEAAELGLELEDLVFDFEGSDGFRSSSTPTCVDHVPAPGPWLRRGYLHPTSRDLAWDEELAMPGCAHVTGLARLLASEAS